jgi:outer membrane cobalamin receptor
MLRIPVVQILLLFSLQLSAQYMTDSVFLLKPFEIESSRYFNKENAGMKELSVDTLVLLQKINLSLSDVLSENTPVFIRSYGRGALATASFRGTAESHTQVIWNGININTPMAGMVDFSLIPVYIIDEMSLRYGAASIADRGGGLGGSIDISNNPDWDNKASAKFMQGFGSYGTFDDFLQVSLGNTKFQSKTRAYYNYSKNDYTFLNRATGEIDPETGKISHPLDTNKNANFLRYGFLQEFYFKPNNKHVFSVRWWWQDADRAIPGAAGFEGPGNTNLNNQTDRDNKIVVNWKHYRNKVHWLLQSGYTGKQLDYTLRNYVAGGGEIPAIYSQSTEDSFLNSAVLNVDFSKDFSLETSVKYNYHEVVSGDSVSKNGFAGNRTELSWFVALRKSFAGRLNMNLMLRQDWVDFETIPVIPFFGWEYRLIENQNFFVRGSIARNYHLPSLNDLYWQPGGNPDLEPESGMSYELGTEFNLDAKNRKIKTGLTAFYSDVNNWIIWIPGYKGYWEPENIRNVVAKGIEVNVSFSGKAGEIQYALSGNYACTKSLNYGDTLVWGDESYGKQLVYIPVHSGNLMAGISWKNFHLTWQHNSYSERFTTSNNDISRRQRFYPYFMNDLIIGKEFKMNKITLSAELKIYNLFDETYHSVLYRPMPGRNYLLMIMIKYP